MKRHVAIAAVLVLMLGTVAMAVQGVPGTFMGEVSSVDAEAQTLTVQAAASEADSMTFKVDAETQIQSAEDQSSLSLEDIQAGQHVTVSYEESEGENVARTIEVQAEPTT